VDDSASRPETEEAAESSEARPAPAAAAAAASARPGASALAVGEDALLERPTTFTAADGLAGIAACLFDAAKSRARSAGSADGPGESEAGWHRDEDASGEGTDEGDEEGPKEGAAEEGAAGGGNGSTVSAEDCAAEPERISFHQFIGREQLGRFNNLSLARAQLTRVHVNLALIQRYHQEWTYVTTTHGAPVTHIALAPLEVRSVRVAHKRKSTLSRSDTAKRSTRLSYDSASSTKASQAATSSSVSRNNWSVSATGSIGVPEVWGVGASGSMSGSTEQSRQQSVSYVADETVKSSRQIQVDTETTTKTGLETTFEHVEDHVLRNPYADRGLHLTVLQLTDCFQVQTYSADTRPCIILDFDPVDVAAQRKRSSLEFDDAFVQLHAQFVRTCLADEQLAYVVDLYASGANGTEPAAHWEEATKNAERCLRFMYRDEHVFAAPGAQVDLGVGTPINLDPIFDLARSFDVTQFPGAAIHDAIANNLTDLYLLIASVRFLWERDRVALVGGDLTRADYARRMVEYVKMLVDGAQQWATLDAGVRKNLHDIGDFTELFRRIPAFLGMAKATVLDPIGHLSPAAPPPSGDDGDATAGSSTAAQTPTRPNDVSLITNHLNSLGRHYTEEYLHFLHQVTGISTVEDLIASAPTQLRELYPLLSFAESFIDRTSWVIPFIQALDASTVVECVTGKPLETTKPGARTDVVRLPADGVRIEAVASDGTLADLPVASSGWNAFVPVQVDEFDQPSVPPADE